MLSRDAMRMFFDMRSFCATAEVTDITVLTDSPGAKERGTYPSRSKFLEALARIIRITRSGEGVVVHFSGHGFEVSSNGAVLTKSGSTIDSRTQECLLLRHDAATPSGNIGLRNTACATEVFDVLRTAATGAHVLFTADSCASGDMLDLAYNMQASGANNRADFTLRRNCRPPALCS